MMTKQNIYRQFNQQAILCNLTGRQMQLWQTLYDWMESRHQQEIQLYTPMLQKVLQISRSQLHRVREALVNAGFLTVRYNGRQQLCYTLLFQGEVVSFAAETDKNQETLPEEPTPLSAAAVQALREPLAQNQVPESLQNMTVGQNVLDSMQPYGYAQQATANCTNAQQISADAPLAKQQWCEQNKLQRNDEVILNKQYNAPLQEFYQQYGDRELRGMLRNWAEMRLKNGWKLGHWGLQALLEKLVDLGQGEISAMIDIVKQSLARRWKGFYPLQVESRPNGKALRKLEEKEEMMRMRKQRYLPGLAQKHQTDDRDLSFLEE